MFCLPYAGSGAAAYRPWLGQLPANVELNLVQLPGRETRLREAPYTRLAALVDDLGSAIEAVLDRPYAIFGHSMGALISFELVRELRRRGAPMPLSLFVSGRRAPQLPDPELPLHELPDDRFVTEMERRYNGIPQIIRDDAELMQLFLPTLRADFEVIETYSYVDESPLACPIVALGGQHDSQASSAELLAWQAQTSAGFSMHLLPGDHFYLQQQRAALIDEITGILDAEAALQGATAWAS